jgi:hypothetical protein
MKLPFYALLLVLAGCARVEETAGTFKDASTPDASEELVPFAGDFPWYSVRFKEDTQIFTRPGTRDFNSFSFDLSEKNKVLLQGPTQTSSTYYPGKTYGQYYNGLFSDVDSFDGACNPKNFEYMATVLQADWKPFQRATVRYGRLRFVTAFNIDSFDTMILCFSTHSDAGWKWHTGRARYTKVNDSDINANIVGNFYADFLVNERDIDQIAFNGNIEGGIVAFEYEAIAP